MEKKISAVAYRLTLPTESCIFPIFHITLLKAYKGDIPENDHVPIPPLTMDAHPVDIPSGVPMYRRIVYKGRVSEQVLVDWQGLGQGNLSRRDLKSIARLVPSMNLEDKVLLKKVGMLQCNLTSRR